MRSESLKPSRAASRASRPLRGYWPLASSHSLTLSDAERTLGAALPQSLHLWKPELTQLVENKELVPILIATLYGPTRAVTLSERSESKGLSSCDRVRVALPLALTKEGSAQRESAELSFADRERPAAGAAR